MGDVPIFADDDFVIVSSLLSNGVLTIRPLAHVIASSVGIVSLRSMDAFQLHCPYYCRLRVQFGICDVGKCWDILIISLI